jgi:L-iditol 2-dehydrogenase
MRKLVLKAPYELEMTTAEIPEPKKDQVRIFVKKMGICGSDPTIYKGLHPYVSYPLVMGHEFSGVIDKVGEGVDASRIGERVAVIPHIVCRECDACKAGVYNFCEDLKCTGAEADGAHCDYFCIDSEMAVKIPDEMSLEEAAMVEPACVAYHGAKRGNIQKGEVALVIGAGPIGLFCMQSCFALGAGKVFVADMDKNRLALAKKLGATGVIAVGEEDLKEKLTEFLGSEKKVDVFYDCVGEKGVVLNNILSLARRGSKVVVIGVLQKAYNIHLLPDFVQHELSLSGTTMYVPQDYYEMIDLMGKKIIKTDGMVSQRITLEEIPKMLDDIVNRRVQTYKVIVDIND